LQNKLFKFLLVILLCPIFLMARVNYNAAKPSSEKLYRADEAPHPLKGLEVTENIGKPISLDLKFTDETGQAQSLQSYFKERSVLMTVVYYNCPSLCNFHLNGLWKALNGLDGKRYEFVVVSMDETEKPELALQKKQAYLKEFPKVPAERVHFLTGSKSSIETLTNELGFAFRWDEETEQFAHAPVAYSLSTKGIISRYLYGVEFLPQTLRLALLEAGQGKLASVMDRVLLFCYKFNPKNNKYTLYASNIMRVGGAMVVLLIISLMLPAWMRERSAYS